MRIQSKGRVGGEGSGANGAHESIRVVVREVASLHRGFFFRCSSFSASFRNREQSKWTFLFSTTLIEETVDIFSTHMKGTHQV